MSEEETIEAQEETEEVVEIPEEEVTEPEEPVWKKAGFDSEDDFVKKASNLNKWERDLRYESMKKSKDEPEPTKPEPEDDVELAPAEMKVLEKAFKKVYGIGPEDIDQLKAFANGYARESETRVKQYVDEFAESNPDVPFDEVVELAKQYNLPASTPEELKEALVKAKGLWTVQNLDTVMESKKKEWLEEVQKGGDVIDIKPKREVPDAGKATINDFDAATSEEERYEIAKKLSS